MTKAPSVVEKHQFFARARNFADSGGAQLVAQAELSSPLRVLLRSPVTGDIESDASLNLRKALNFVS